MKILFVWPNQDKFGSKPMGMALLSAILKSKGHDVELFDTTFIDFGYKGHVEVRNQLRMFKEVDFSKFDVAKRKLDLEAELTKKINDFKPDIVGVSALLDERYVGLQISSIVKKINKNIIVVWGSKSVTVAPENILGCKDIDFACIGEGIEFMPDFVERVSVKSDPRSMDNIAYMEGGRLQKNALRPYFQDLDSLPFLDWSIFDNRHFLTAFDGKVYRGAEHMIFWGCPNQCTYCINSFHRKLYGQKAGNFLRHYSVDRVIKELKYLKEKWSIEFFKFLDEDFCLKNMDYFKQLAEKYKIDIGIPFTIMANARHIDAEKTALLKKMNCASVTLGIETGDRRLRKEVLKRNETEEDIIEATKMLNDAGIRTSSFNMLGIPFENRESIMETIELNRKAEVRYPTASFFFPFEKTELREIAIKNGFFDGDKNAMYLQDKPTLTFKDISTEELIALRERFVLYIKMPKVFYKYIELSEKNDAVGRDLTEELYRIYEECVFANNGIWDDHGRQDEYMGRLNDIIEKKNNRYSVRK